jgi:hypothetical protein
MRAQMYGRVLASVRADRHGSVTFTVVSEHRSQGMDICQSHCALRRQLLRVRRALRKVPLLMRHLAAIDQVLSDLFADGNRHCYGSVYLQPGMVWKTA